MTNTEDKLITLVATAIAWLSFAIIWINENGNPFREQDLSGDSSEQ